MGIEFLSNNEETIRGQSDHLSNPRFSVLASVDVDGKDLLGTTVDFNPKGIHTGTTWRQVSHDAAGDAVFNKSLAPPGSLPAGQGEDAEAGGPHRS